MKNLGTLMLALGLLNGGCGLNQMRSGSQDGMHRAADKSGGKNDGRISQSDQRMQPSGKNQIQYGLRLAEGRPEHQLTCDASGCDLLIQQLLGTDGQETVTSVTACLIPVGPGDEGGGKSELTDGSCDDGVLLSLQKNPQSGVYEARTKARQGAYLLIDRVVLDKRFRSGGIASIDLKPGSQRFAGAGGHNCKVSNEIKARINAFLGMPDMTQSEETETKQRDSDLDQSDLAACVF